MEQVSYLSIRASQITPFTASDVRVIEQSARALDEGDVGFFSETLPRQEWWRLYPNLESKVVFLDIETTGLSHYYDDVTMVGLYDGKRVETLMPDIILIDCRSSSLPTISLSHSTALCLICPSSR